MSLVALSYRVWGGREFSRKVYGAYSLLNAMDQFRRDYFEGRAVEEVTVKIEGPTHSYVVVIGVDPNDDMIFSIEENR